MMNRREMFSVLGAGFLMYPTAGLAFSLPLNIVATTGMIADLIQNVGGSLLNVNSFIDHVFLTGYAANTSWEHNREWWKEKRTGSKWQWLIVDLDRGFNYSNIFRNLIDNLIEDYELFSLLLENQVFKQKFAQRSAAHLNNTFAPMRIQNIVDSLSNVISSEITNHIERWSELGGIESYNEWVNELQEIKEFAMDRPNFVFEQIDEELNLNGTVNVNVSITPLNSGKVLSLIHI